MSLDAEVGAKVELGEFSLKALMGLGATLDGIHQSLKTLIAVEKAYQFGAVNVELSGQVSSDSASDTIAIDLGGPMYARQWQIRQLTIGGPLWSTTVAGTAFVVVQSAKNLTPVLSDIVDEAGSLPAVAQYSTGQIVVRHPNRLWVIVTSPTASQQYVAGGGATDLPDKREQIEVGT